MSASVSRDIAKATAEEEAIVELPELARGIRPSALDNGLAVALETLIARCPISATVDTDLRSSPDPAVLAIVYLCVAELVTNVVQHADASGVYALVDERGDELRIRVRDDGRGGADARPPNAHGDGSGLSRLAGRVTAIGGTVDVASPIGGPTVVTVTLPLQMPQ